MTIRDLLNKAFRKPTEPPQRRHDDKANVEARARAEEERKTATAIDAKQADLLRTHLTPELTPYGTQPHRPPGGDEARALAEKLVTGKDRADDPAANEKASARTEPPEAGKDFAARADTNRADKPAKDESRAGPARELLQAEKVDDRTRTGPLEAETITPPYVADITTLQAGHEVEAGAALDPASWTREERAARVAEQVAIIEAEQASAALTHTHSGGRTM